MSHEDIERRITLSEATVEYRDVDGMKKPVISGYAAVFNTESKVLSGFVETIAPTAFDEVLATNPDVIGCFNHDKNMLLGRTSNGTMTLRNDGYGLRYEITPNPNTSVGRDVVEWVKDRTVVGSSFAFSIKKDGTGDSWTTDSRGFRKREVRSIAMLEDCGPVVRPAYASSSVVVSRRAIEMALGDFYRPNQTMANSAKRGLKLAAKHTEIDGVLAGIAERIAGREVVSVEEVLYLTNVHERCDAAKADNWAGTPAWVEYQLAGGDSGRKWIERRDAADGDGEIDFTPPAGVREEAARGLRWRKEYRRGATMVGVARARDLSNGKKISPSTARRMKSYFARHEVDKKGQGWNPGDEGFPSAGRIAWACWGGDPGRSFCEKLVRQMEARDGGERSADDVEPPPQPAAEQAAVESHVIEQKSSPAVVDTAPAIDYAGQAASLKAKLLTTWLHGLPPTR